MGRGLIRTVVTEDWRIVPTYNPQERMLRGAQTGLFSVSAARSYQAPGSVIKFSLALLHLRQIT